MIEIVSRAHGFSKQVAIRSDGKTFTYQELLDQSNIAASYMMGSHSGLRGKRVAFMVKPGFDYVKIQWGIWRAGGIAVPLNPGTPLAALEYTLKDSGAEILIVSPEYGETLEGGSPVERLFTTAEIEGTPTKLPDIQESDPAMILYTSGTTGSPKGVVTTHSNIRAQITSLVEAWKWSVGDSIVNVLPLHHVHGIINIVSCALWSGATCHFLPKFDEKAIFKLIEDRTINLFMAVPTIYYKLIKYYEELPLAERQKLSEALVHMRLMVSGSAALPVSTLEKWKEISGHTLLERYGMTEIGMAISNPYNGERRPGHIGQPLPQIQVRLVEEDGNLAEGPGEIQVKGPGVFKEYWKRQKATDESFTEDGWFKTGDIAQVFDGSYKILGRNSVDIIKSGGYKISALEIEEVLRKHPLVKDCGVVGIPDEEWGEIIGAGIISESEIDTETLKNWLKEKLPGYKIPRKYLFLEDLPRNAMGKVTKKELTKLFEIQ